jgi:WD40 repeat protein/beta-lactamase regulating signal transducer with metallopeptidase domain
MTTLLAIVLANAACAAVLAIPAFLLGRYGRRPALAHALWLLVLLKLVTPPVMRPTLFWLPAEMAPAAKTPVAYAPGSPGRTPVAYAPGSPLPPVAYAPGSPKSTPVAYAPGSPVEALVELRATEEMAAQLPAASAESNGIGSFLAVVWLLGAGTCLARVLLYAARFAGLLAAARPAPADLQEQAREIARHMGMKRCPAVWLIPGSLPPMVWGVGPARILFPVRLLDRLGSDERASLLAHELGHVARRDHVVRWLELAVATVYWWYPLVWWARRQMHEREEECCDAWAAGAVSARVYASAILEAVDFLAESRPHVPSVACPLAAAQALRQRLVLVMTRQTPPGLSGPLRMAVLALFVAVAPLLPVLASADQSETAEAASVETDSDNVSGLRETYSFTFSPDGKSVAAASGSAAGPGEVAIWDVLSHNLTWKLAETRGISSVRFSPDSKRLAWAGWGGIARTADLFTRKNVFSLTLDSPGRLAISPDRRWLASARDAGPVRMIDVSTGWPAFSFDGEGANVFSFAYSGDSRFLAAGSGKVKGVGANVALVYDIQKHKRVARLAGHTRAVINIAFAPRNSWIATSSADNTVRVWEGKSYKLVKVLTGHTGCVAGLAFSPDGSLLATGSFDKSIRFWDYRAGKQIAQLDGPRAAVGGLAFSPDGALLVSGGPQRSVMLWNVLARKAIARLPSSPGPASLPSPPGPLSQGGRGGAPHPTGPLSKGGRGGEGGEGAVASKTDPPSYFTERRSHP